MAGFTRAADMMLSVTCENKVYEGRTRDFERLYGHLRGKTVLDVGCGSGYVSSYLQERGNACYGITLSSREASLAAGKMTDARVVDLESARTLPYKEGFFDAVLFLDVLEHLRDPKRTIELVLPYLKPGAEIIASIPNVANFGVRFGLLFGKFEYQDYGILDRTHLHFFTRKTARELMESAGLAVKEMRYTHQWNLPKLIRKPLDFCEWEMREKVTRQWPGLFATQFVIYSHCRET
ncbi:MAG TPA: class I SAM-dependent methyltransferase [Verrucomicrobiae bacterium]|nr:class I SAM-dependent methyltransferase [Verrucomicrobiae bacterium]